MHTCLRRLILCGLVYFGSCLIAQGATYSDPAGFSFRFPDDWVAINSSVLQSDKGKLPPDIQKWLNENKVDFSNIKVMLLHKGAEALKANVNVVVHDQQVPISEEDSNKLLSVLRQQFESMGIKHKEFRGQVEKVNSRDVITIHSISTLPTIAAPFRQKQVYLPGGGKTFIVTCTGGPEDFDKFTPTFDMILNSFQAPEPLAKSYFSPIIRNAIIYSVAGGAIGIVAGLFMWLSKRSKQTAVKAQPDSGT